VSARAGMGSPPTGSPAAGDPGRAPVRRVTAFATSATAAALRAPAGCASRPRGRGNSGSELPLPRQVVKVLDVDPDLGEGIAGSRLAAAGRDVRAVAIDLPKEPWDEPHWGPRLRAGIGLLVLEGLLVRRLQLDGRYGAELLGRGDILRPWQPEDAVASFSGSTGWRCLERCTVAVLDVDFTRRIAPYPEITGALVARTLRRARHLAVTLAILNQPRVERRLLVALWQMADRWGVVRSDGVLVPTRLPHSVLAEVLAARRPTVTTALGSLQAAGQISQSDRGWVLHGGPPGELAEVVEASG